MSAPTPVLYLPLDEKFGDKLRDESGGKRNGVAHGAVRVVTDATFGACAELVGGTITLPPLDGALVAGGATIAVWYDVAQRGRLLEYGVTRTAAGNWVTAERDLIEFSATAGQSYTVSTPSSGWRLLVFTATPRGLVVRSGSVSTNVWWQPNFPVTITLGSGELPGRVGAVPVTQRLARFRVFRGELSAAQVEALRQGDLSPAAGSDAGLPLDLTLEDADAAPILRAGAAMTVRAAPTSPVPLTLPARPGPASAENWHLQVTLRPGTLGDLGDVSTSTPGWQVATARDARGDTLYLATHTAQTLPVSVALAGLTPASPETPRTTRVRLAYRHLTPDMGGPAAALAGVRTHALTVAPAATEPTTQGWQPLALINGWALQSGMGGPEWSMDADGVIHLRGTCEYHPRTPGNAATPFVLPHEARERVEIATRVAVTWLRGQPDGSWEHLPPRARSLEIVGREVHVVDLDGLAAELVRARDASMPTLGSWIVTMFLDGASYRRKA